MTKQDDDYTQNNEQKNTQQPRTLFSVPVTGCLMVIILSAIAGIMVNECKRSKIRLENDRQKYQQNDTVASNATAQNTLFLKYLPRSH